MSTDVATERKDLEKLKEAIERIPQIRATDLSEVSPERLGGLTNIVFTIDEGNKRQVVRIPGEGTEEYIDRTVEHHNAVQAAAAGVSADVHFFDEEDGLMLCDHIEGRTMSPQAFQADRGAIERAGEALARMHRSGREFKFRFELFSMIDSYLEVLSNAGCPLPDGYQDVVREAQSVRAALEKHPQPLAPCHNDPLCENFLDNGTRTYIVDWEYSGMNEALWDVGDVSVEAGLNNEQDFALLRAYSGGTVRDYELGRMKVYKAMCDLLWTLWGLIQYANDNPAEDFWAYSTERFERCKALMRSPEFSDYVRAVEAGR